MAGFDNVVAIKWAAPGYPYEAIFDLKDKVNIIDNTKDPTRNHRMGGRGFINWTSEIHPPHDLAVWDLMEEGKYEEARTLWFSVYDQLSEFYAKTGAISGGQARVKKGMMKVMGMDIGDLASAFGAAVGGRVGRASGNAERFPGSPCRSERRCWCRSRDRR